MTWRPVSAWWLVSPVVLFGSNFVYGLTVHVDQSNLVYQPAPLISNAVLDGLLAGYVLLAVRSSHVDPADTLALRRTPWRPAVALAALVFAAITVLDIVVDALLGASRQQGITPTHTPRDGHQWLSLGIALVALVVIAPIAEELTFRGLCFASMGRFALPGSAALFAVAHALPVLLLPVFLAGLGLGWLRRRTDSLYPGLAVHMSLNATALAVALLTA
jgi:membrane protease YdiL (CAAX protease family)